MKRTTKKRESDYDYLLTVQAALFTVLELGQVCIIYTVFKHDMYRGIRALKYALEVCCDCGALQYDIRLKEHDFLLRLARSLKSGIPVCKFDIERVKFWN